MPHYGLMDATKMTEAETALMCARLYLSSGKRQLQKGSSAAGLASLYDALLFGMRYYIAGPARAERINISSNDLWDCAALYDKLAKAGIFDDASAFNRLSLSVERALWQASVSFDADFTLAEVEKMLMKLGVMPFNEAALPRESLAVC